MKFPKKSVVLLLLGAVLLSTSCFRRDGNRTVLLPYVQRLVSDTTSAQFDVLQRVNPKSKSGAITVLGEPTDVVRLTEALLRCDRFNNIDGSLSPDGLPDFAGEVIAPVLDAANAPYAPYMEAGNEEFLRELHVRNFLSVMDTTCVFSPFDLEDRLPKPSAKVLVLASSLSAEYGEADIDTLCAIAGKPIPVVSSVGAMIDNVLQAHAPDCHFAVWTVRDKLGAGIYSQALRRAARSSSRIPTMWSFVPDSSETLRGRFLSLLDMYLAAGGTQPLSAIVVDEPYLQADTLDAIAVSLRNSDEVGYQKYRDLLAADFSAVDVNKAVTAWCFRTLRQTNGFTHRIAFPEVSAYLTVPAGGLPADAYYQDGRLQETYKYNRAPVSDLITTRLVECRQRYLDEETARIIRQEASKTNAAYVR